MWHKIYSGLSAALIYSSAIVMVQPQVAVSQTLDEQAIAAMAKEVTVIINGQNPGSGVIIGQEGSTYYVLTAKHVVKTQDEYEIVTSDGQSYTLNYRTIRKLPDADLAVVQFTSNQNYPVAKIGDSDVALQGKAVYISGYPHPGQAITQRIFQLTLGGISGRLGVAEDGYELVYTNITRSGMSGGPIFDATGHLIGIHGRAEGTTINNPNNQEALDVKSGFNLGIPLKTFIELTEIAELPKNSSFAYPLSIWGNQFLKQNQLPEAISYYQKALTMDSQYVLAIFGLGQVKYEQGNTEAALRQWQTALETDNKEAGLQLARAAALYTQGNEKQGLMLASATLQTQEQEKQMGNFEIEDPIANIYSQRLLADTKKILAFFSPKQTLTHSTNPSARLYSAAISSDGKIIASGGEDKTIKLWEVSSGKLLQNFIGHSERINTVAFSPDGQLIASGDDDNTIRVWNIGTGEELYTLMGDSNSFGQIKFVGFSPNGETLISGVGGGTIKVWNIKTGKEIRTINQAVWQSIGTINTLNNDSNSIISMAFSSDGQTVAFGSNKNTIKLWNINTGQEIKTLTGHSDEVKAVAFSPDGKLLVSGDRDHIIKLWDVSTGQELGNLIGHSDRIESVAFSPDGKTLASGSGDGYIKLWIINTGEELFFQKVHEFINFLVFSSDSQLLISPYFNWEEGDYMQEVAIWQVPAY
jgi:tetratricopeptide (TPR) repeat protein